jgi:hypothetical protein
MIVLNAQQLQRLAESLMRLERLLEAEGGDPTVVREGLDETAYRMGVHLEAVRLADAATLLSLHGPASGGDPARLWAMAELLFLDGLRAAAQEGGTEASHRIRTALTLFAEVDPGLEVPEGIPSPPRRIEEGRRLLGNDRGEP